MNLELVLLLSAALAVSPWLLLPGSGRGEEIRGSLRLLAWLNHVYCVLWHHLETGEAPLPEEGPAILISNHTCGIDHLLLQAGSRRLLGFLVAREFYEARALHWICTRLGCIPVRRDGSDLSATRSALRSLEEGRVVPMFPEGKILPTSGRELGAGKSGVAFLALHARVPVIPAYISGTPETNEVWPSLLTPSRSRVIYGGPVDLSDLPQSPPFDRATLALATERLMGAIRALHDRAARERGGQPVAAAADRGGNGDHSGPA